ncbi:hypothetical protein [Staphylococcus phage ZCSS1]|nr:hypothetical protein [Staphylococcus phage ZCSS1]
MSNEIKELQDYLCLNGGIRIGESKTGLH